MNFDYEPLSEEEARKERYQLIEDGVCRGKIMDATGKMSSSDNPMGVFILRIWDKHGKTKEITDYITFTKSMIWKLRHLCNSIGMIKEFEEKRFSPELAIDKDVYVHISIQKGKEIPFDKLNGKPPGTKYPDRNVIDDYVIPMSPQASMIQPIKPKDDAFIDDDLPF